MVEGAAGLEPVNLRLVERVVQADLHGLAVRLGDDALDRLARRQLIIKKKKENKEKTKETHKI